MLSCGIKIACNGLLKQVQTYTSTAVTAVMKDCSIDTKTLSFFFWNGSFDFFQLLYGYLTTLIVCKYMLLGKRIYSQVFVPAVHLYFDE